MLCLLEGIREPRRERPREHGIDQIAISHAAGGLAARVLKPGNVPSVPGVPPGSRAYCFSACLGSSTTPGPAMARDLSPSAGVAFPLTEKGRRPVLSFRSSIAQPTDASVYASTRCLATARARLEVRMESLLLSRRALSSPTICRFIPAHSVPGAPPALPRRVYTDGGKEMARICRQSDSKENFLAGVFVAAIWVLTFDVTNDAKPNPQRLAPSQMVGRLPSLLRQTIRPQPSPSSFGPCH